MTDVAVRVVVVVAAATTPSLSCANQKAYQVQTTIGILLFPVAAVGFGVSVEEVVVAFPTSRTSLTDCSYAVAVVSVNSRTSSNAAKGAGWRDDWCPARSKRVLLSRIHCLRGIPWMVE